MGIMANFSRETVIICNFFIIQEIQAHDSSILTFSSISNAGS